MGHKVFVYGSLLSGMGNHMLLSNAKYLGEAKTTPKFAMLDLGWFPGVIESEPGMEIVGEVYEVNDEQLARLDRLEGYNDNNPTSGLYNRKTVETTLGEAIIYIYNNNYGRTVNYVVDGNWRNYFTYNKKRRIY